MEKDTLYQDPKTGNIYSFSPLQIRQKVWENNRNTPKNLTTDVKQRPSENHKWHNGEWVEKELLPKDYEEPISDIPSYDPAWITFLFEPLTIISNDTNIYNISLEEINENLYDSRLLSKFVTKLKDNDNDLDILVTYDGSAMLPINDRYSSPEKAIDKFNEIIGALFLGGILVKPLDMVNLYQGGIAENGGSNFCYQNSPNNDFRNKSVNITERIKAHYPNYIKLDDFISSYEFGKNIISKKHFSPIFLSLGYHYLNQGKIAESLSNLWIVVEQLTDILCKNKIDLSTLKLLKRVLPKKMSIEIKHNILHELKIINENTFQILLKNREDRNKLLHKGRLPKRENVAKLWYALLDLLEIAIDYKLTHLRNNSKNIIDFNLDIQIKDFNPKNTNFDQWKKDSENL